MGTVPTPDTHLSSGNEMGQPGQAAMGTVLTPDTHLSQGSWPWGGWKSPPAAPAAHSCSEPRVKPVPCCFSPAAPHKREHPEQEPLAWQLCPFHAGMHPHPLGCAGARRGWTPHHRCSAPGEHTCTPEPSAAPASPTVASEAGGSLGGTGGPTSSPLLWNAEGLQLCSPQRAPEDLNLSKCRHALFS